MAARITFALLFRVKVFLFVNIPIIRNAKQIYMSWKEVSMAMVWNEDLSDWQIKFIKIFILKERFIMNLRKLIISSLLISHRLGDASNNSSNTLWNETWLSFKHDVYIYSTLRWTVFLSSAAILFTLPGPFFVLVVGVVLPAVAFNLAAVTILYNSVQITLKRISY